MDKGNSGELVTSKLAIILIINAISRHGCVYIDDRNEHKTIKKKSFIFHLSGVSGSFENLPQGSAFGVQRGPS